MDQQTSDQGWEQLQTHIESFLSRTLINDTPKIEYTPRYVALLAMPSGHHPNTSQETGT